MAPKFDLSGIWRNVKELDLQRIREAAEQDVRLFIVGPDPAQMQLLANQLRSDPRRPEAESHIPIPLVDLGSAGEIASADLILVIAAQDAEAAHQQAQLLGKWAIKGLRVIVIRDLAPNAPDPDPALLPLQAGTFPVVLAPIDHWGELHARLVPRILEQLPDRALALGRRFPLMRETVARNLISETSTANAAYAFSTGLAEIIPILDIPLNVADILILTKAQALLVYKVGLALGLSSDWQYYITEFGGVIGSGFLWRQVARSLVGLIPAWGIVPKVAVAYSGTYAVGQAVLHWYLTGRHVTRKMLQGFSKEAMERGKLVGQNLVKRLGRSRKKQPELLPESAPSAPAGPPEDAQICPQCATINDSDARFCKNCAYAF